MTYRILLSISIGLFIWLSAANFVSLSSGTMQVGTPVCEIQTEESGVRCGRVRCSFTTLSLSEDDFCTPTHPLQQTASVCENLG